MGLKFGAHGWLPEQGRALRPTTDRLLRAAGVSEGMAVLDIYCGPGDVTMIAADRVGSGGRVIGIDPRAEAISYAQSRSAAAGYTNIEYRRADLADPVAVVIALRCGAMPACRDRPT